MSIIHFFYIVYFISEKNEVHDITADVVFLVDSSFEVTSGDYNKEKAFVKSLARSFNLAPGKTRASVILYSTYPRPIINLNDYNSMEAFGSAVDQLPHIRRTRRMDRALDAAATALGGARDSVAKIVILLTNGKQAREEGATSLRDAAQPLRDLGAKMFVVAISSGVDSTELAPLVENAGDMFRVPSFGGLQDKERQIAKEIADKAGESS